MIKGINPNIIPSKFQKIFNDNIEIIKQRYPDCIDTSGKNISFTQKGLLFADRLIPDMLL